MRRASLTAFMVGLSVCGRASAEEVASTPASPAAAPTPAAPTAAEPPGVPAPPTAPDPRQVVVPPGYKLVRIGDDEDETRYDVQYPQGRGALPPGMELPYEDGDPIPPGYRLRRQPRYGLVIAGSIMTGVAWMFSVTGAVGNDFEDETGFLLIPGVGPWLMLAAGGGRDRDCASTDYCNRSRAELRAILALDGMVQTSGTVMFVLGLMYPRTRLVRKDVTVSVVPTTLGPGGYGLGAVGTF